MYVVVSLDFYFYFTLILQKYIKLFWFSYICYDLLNILEYDLLWRNFFGLLRRTCVVWLLSGIFCKCLLSLFDLYCCLILMLLFF
jgi:hypothetical protein